MKLIEDGFFKRNKKLLVISFVIFLVFALAGAVFGFIKIGDNYGAVSNLIRSGNATGSIELSSFQSDTLYYFIHNLSSDIIVVLGGLLFSVISLAIIILNAVSIGAPFGADLSFAVFSILPHAIIEYSASAIALATAFKITKLEIGVIKSRSFKDISKTDLKDILVLVIVMVVLLAVAAVIECNITPVIISWYFGA